MIFLENFLWYDANNQQQHEPVQSINVEQYSFHLAVWILPELFSEDCFALAALN